MAFRFWLGDFSFSCGQRGKGNGGKGGGSDGAARLAPPPPPPPPALWAARTLILWKLTLQLAPALEGMKRSPCLLGEDTGELAGVRVRRISATWKDGRAGLVPESPPARDAKASLSSQTPGQAYPASSREASGR